MQQVEDNGVTSVPDTVRAVSDVLLPTLAQGVIARRPWVVSAFDRLAAQAAGRSPPVAVSPSTTAPGRPPCTCCTGGCV